MFDLKIGFSIPGIIIFILPMIINIVYFILPPVNAPVEAADVHSWIEMVEQATRILYAIAIVFLVSRKPIEVKNVWLILAVVLLVLYYVVWIRYFMGGRDVALLGKSFLFVPMPLAVFPVLYFICAALWLHNGVAAIVMVIFGIAHNIVSYRSFSK